MRAVWRASLQLEQVRLELLQALRRLGNALRGAAACDLICACHASQRSHYLCHLRRCAAGEVLHAAVLPCCQQGSMPVAGLADVPHGMHMPAHARSCPAQELPLCAAGGHGS